MLKNLIHRIRRTPGATESHPVAAELKLRQELAFSILHPQVQVVKNSPTAQIVVGTIVTAAVLTGNWGTAAVVGGCWLGSRPLPHVAASGVAGVGMVDAKLLAAIEQLQAMQVEPLAAAVLNESAA